MLSVKSVRENKKPWNWFSCLIRLLGIRVYGFLLFLVWASSRDALEGWIDCDWEDRDGEVLGGCFVTGWEFAADGSCCIELSEKEAEPWKLWTLLDWTLLNCSSPWFSTAYNHQEVHQYNRIYNLRGPQYCTSVMRLNSSLCSSGLFKSGNSI